MLRKSIFNCAKAIVVTVFALGLLSAQAVDGLKISIQDGKDVLLRWPSVPGQTYLILHTKSLTAPIQWTVLATEYPATEATNETTYIHYDQVPLEAMNLTGSDDQSSEPFSTDGMSASEARAVKLLLQSQEPLCMLNSDVETLLPVSIYPPGFDFSNFLIYDPAVSDWIKGSEFSRPQSYAVGLGGAILNGAEESDGEDGLSPNCGFYEVMGITITGGITNGSSVSDYISSIAARPEAGLKYLQLLVDGHRYPAQDLLMPPFTNAIAFEWVDTTRLMNGSHTIQAEAVYHIPTIASEGLHHVLSQPFEVNVFNELSFPAWDDLTEDEVCNFDIVSAHAVVDWEIDVYNIFDYIDWLNGVVPYIDPIHVKIGNTTNGVIQYDWNFVDDFGQPRNDPNYDPYFVSFTYTQWSDASQSSGTGPHPMDAGGSAATGNPVKRQPAKWPPLGHWVVAWQDMFKHLYDRDNRLHNAFSAIRAMANLPDTPPFWQGPIGGTNAQTFPVRFYYNPYRTDLNPTNEEYYQSTLNDQFLLELMLRDSRARNFFYFGHGEPNWICSSIYANLLRDYGMHRYRFVWLDGCETGTGSWPETFGIPGPGTFSIEYYKERTKRPALFVGNRYSVPTGNIYSSPQTNGAAIYDGEVSRSLPEFYGQFIFYWQTLGRSYKDAVEQAQLNVRGAFPSSYMRYVDGPKAGSVYWPGDDQVRVGYEDMRYNGYNYDYDIPRP
jgi:hypothetical protein